MSQLPQEPKRVETEIVDNLLQDLDVSVAQRQISASRWLSRSAATDAGYATYNNVPHLCVDVPDGGHTITVRLSNGHSITFSFTPYVEGGVPRGVDIKDHTGNGNFVMNGHMQVPEMSLLVWTPGHPIFSAQPDGGATLVTLLLT